MHNDFNDSCLRNSSEIKQSADRTNTIFEEKLSAVAYSLRNMDSRKISPKTKNDCYTSYEKMKRKRDITSSINLAERDCHYPNGDTNTLNKSINKPHTSFKYSKNYKQILNYNSRKPYKGLERLSLIEDDSEDDEARPYTTNSTPDLCAAHILKSPQISNNSFHCNNFEYKNLNMNTKNKNNKNFPICPIWKSQKIPELYNLNMNNHMTNLTPQYTIDSSLNVKRRCYDRQQQDVNNKIEFEMNLNNFSPIYNNSKSLLCKSKLLEVNPQKRTRGSNNINNNSSSKYDRKNIETIEILDSTDSEDSNILPHTSAVPSISKFEKLSCKKEIEQNDMSPYLIRDSSSDSNSSAKKLPTPKHKKNGQSSQNIELTAQDKKKCTQKSSNTSKMGNENMNANNNDSNTIYSLENAKFRSEMEAITQISSNRKLKF